MIDEEDAAIREDVDAALRVHIPRRGIAGRSVAIAGAGHDQRVLRPVAGRQRENQLTDVTGALRIRARTPGKPCRCTTFDASLK